MKCPIDGADLMMTERQGIEIDYCPKCRGVWLDRGELDKLIERSLQVERQAGGGVEIDPEYGTALPKAKPGYYPDDDDDYRRSAPPRTPYYDDDDYRNPQHSQHPHKKRKSFLGDLFDIFD